MSTEAQSQCLQCAGARTDRGRAMQTRLLDTVDLVLAAAQLSVDHPTLHCFMVARGH